MVSEPSLRAGSSRSGAIQDGLWADPVGAAWPRAGQRDAASPARLRAPARKNDLLLKSTFTSSQKHLLLLMVHSRGQRGAQALAGGAGRPQSSVGSSTIFPMPGSASIIRCASAARASGNTWAICTLIL